VLIIMSMRCLLDVSPSQWCPVTNPSTHPLATSSTAQFPLCHETRTHHLPSTIIGRRLSFLNNMQHTLLAPCNDRTLASSTRHKASPNMKRAPCGQKREASLGAWHMTIV
jgi:hypothetical protein